VKNIFGDEISMVLRGNCISIPKSAVVDGDKQFGSVNAFSERASVVSLRLIENINYLISELVDSTRWGFWGRSNVSLSAEAPWHKDDVGGNIIENYFGLDAVAADSAEIIKFAIYRSNQIDSLTYSNVF
jgi:hypothetical protein